MEGDIIKIRRDYKRTNLCWSEKKMLKLYARENQ